ncbi:hypothetical protein ABDD95_07775 [Mucilaginibacter sp. PAMB04274]|uniref:hypothetical protein n=1 Tax=Mucilaginibacter sp. PAMB04274 TaxID=3138568 RepID=UPI0031F6CEE4
MQIDDFLRQINDLDFQGIVRRETRAFLEQNANYYAYERRDEHKKLLADGARRFASKSDKTIFYAEAINYFNERLDWLAGRLLPARTGGSEDEFSITGLEEHSRQQDYQRCKLRYEAQIFYAVRELEKAGVTQLGKDTFSVEQVKELSSKVDQVIAILDKLAAGQEIVFNSIEELRSDFGSLKAEFPLGKKRWYQRAAGIVVSYAGNKGADEIYEHLKPALKRLVDMSPAVLEKLLTT